MSKKKKILSDEHKKNISKSNMGRICTEETKQKIRLAHLGAKRSDAHKKNISAAMRLRKGAKRSEEARKNISTGHVGKKYPNRKSAPPISEETRQKMRKAAIQRIKDNPTKASVVSKSCTEFLNRLENIIGFPITREFELSERFYDGKIGNILIEVDGEYWHRNKTTDDNSDNPIIIDLLKTYIAVKNKYEIYRFKVSSIREIDKKVAEYADKIQSIKTKLVTVK